MKKNEKSLSTSSQKIEFENKAEWKKPKLTQLQISLDTAFGMGSVSDMTRSTVI